MGKQINTGEKKAWVDKNACVACGACLHVCPTDAISIMAGVHAVIDPERCIGCEKCGRVCPASAIQVEVRP